MPNMGDVSKLTGGEGVSNLLGFGGKRRRKGVKKSKKGKKSRSSKRRGKKSRKSRRK